MKTELKAKFIQHLNQNKKSDEGFTLIELLVVIIIIGILSAIALPSFLNQANKARASEAKSYIGTMNRAQQAYILENPVFVTEPTDFSNLGLGIQTQTENYTYGVAAVGDGVTNKATPTTPDTKPAVLKGYAGMVIIGETAGAGTGEATSLAILCETNDPITEAGPLDDPTPTGGTPPTGIDCAGSQKAIQ
ncbi:MAG: prepilin-type N-terminal cleavage/methylation domain-containing protein [Symploca sp. SIO2E6]|nr:prepilin-type N-terminal cleavage/methylation domain-containing protein [Symploca sp. SIO2E6]